MMRLLLLFICFHVLQITFGQEEAITNVSQGILKGLRTITNFNEKSYYSFKGIPYAKPPIGARKFDPPIASDPWIDVFDATQHKSTCIFFCMIKKGIVGDEDCLYLNVYTPDLNKNAKRAVMVFFHPGGYNSGSGDDDIFGPDFLIEQDVIVVTFNSRLGIAGFLSTEDINAPGNIGLKDQVMVLKWIQENIVNFGGCRNRVTLFGTNSGASSIQFHMLSPMSRGLFRSAIIQSGSALNTWAIEYNPKKIAFRLGEALGIKDINTKELMNKLKEYSIQELVTVSAEVTKTLNHMNGHLAPFVPVIEPDVGQDIFLSNDPWTLIKNNDIADIPVMIGINLDETAFMTPLFLSNAEGLDQNFEYFLPDDLNITNLQKKEMSNMLRKFYFDGKPLTSNVNLSFTMMTSDIFYNSGVLMSSKIMGAKNLSPIYKYLLTYDNQFGLMKNLFNVEQGVVHGDELGFLFYSKYLDNKPKLGSANDKMIRILTKLWTNFAKELNPTPILDDDLTITWTPMGSDDNYLNINLPLKMEKGLFEERINFWAQIYNDVLGNYIELFK